MNHLFPHFTSFCLGFLLFHLLAGKSKKIGFGFRLLLSWGIGLGLSVHITFYSYVFFNQLNKSFVIGSHFIILLLLITLTIIFRKSFDHPFFYFQKEDLTSLGGLILLAGFSYLLWTFAHLYPFGGWDAWTTWNFKAKFLFVGGQQWKNMFSPLLWRSSPHYPLFLPLANVWGWIVSEKPVYYVPLWYSIIFSYLTLGLLFVGLKEKSKTLVGFLAALLPLSIPLFCLLGTSQYSDIVLSFYLLGSFICLSFAEEKDSLLMALLSGLFLGFLSFTKSSGTVICGIMTTLITFYFLRQERKGIKSLHLLKILLMGVVLGSIPTVLFILLYSPGNQTFVNGLISQTHPADFERLKIIFLLIGKELISKKWGFIWFVLLAGIILSKGRCFKKAKGLFLPFLLLFGLAVGGYYFINTWWEIRWFFNVSFSRVLLVILPSAIFWVFSSLRKDDRKDTSSS